MTSWWRAPMIAAAISTLACGYVELQLRHTESEADRQLAYLTQEWRSDPQLAAQIDRERDIAGMLGLRREATAFVHAKQRSTFATLAAVMPPPALRAVTVEATRQWFRFSGPVALQPATAEFVRGLKGVRIGKQATNGASFVIEGMIQ